MNYSGEKCVQKNLITTYYEVALIYFCGRQHFKMALRTLLLGVNPVFIYVTFHGKSVFPM